MRVTVSQVDDDRREDRGEFQGSGNGHIRAQHAGEQLQQFVHGIS
ncbi:hypothetical protein [Deinococcus alpinitundrae]|nr:hypothetical protein [Deinococcus alpinitundrae]